MKRIAEYIILFSIFLQPLISSAKSNPPEIKSIAVVGPNADFVVIGDYSWARPDNDEGVSVFKGLKNRLSVDIKINYARGHSSDDIIFSKTITL